MALIDKASLLMVPSTYEAGKLYNVLPSGNRAPDQTGANSGYDQTRADFDFDRGSNTAATRVNADGLIEKYRENLLVQSNQFDTTWTNVNSTETSGQSGYDGSNNAWLLTKTAANGRIYQSVSTSGVQTFSLYAKANDSNWISLWTNVGTSYFDLANGTKGSATASTTIDSEMVSVGNGWYRCSLIFNTSILNVRIYPADGDLDTTGTSGSIYIQNAQLESGMVSTDYLDSTSVTGKAGVLIDLPRIDYSSGAGALLLEPQRANLIRYSEYFGAWVDAGTTTTLSSTTNPSGYAQSYEIAASSSATNALRYDLTFSASTDYSYSLFLKAGTSEEVRMQIYDGNTFQRLAVNPLNNFAVVDQSGINSYSIEDFSNGWKRVVMNFTTTASAGSGYLQIYPDRTGNLNNVEAYGAQLEAGSYSTSYIPNHGTSGGVTRAADSCSVTGVSDVIGQSEGTLFVEIDQPYADGVNGAWSISDGTSTNRITMNTLDVDATTFTFGIATNYAGGSTKLASVNKTYGLHKVAIQYSGTTLKLFVDGALADSVTTDGFGNFTNFYVGANQAGVGDEIREFKQALLFPTPLTDAECITLTTL